MKRRKFVVGLGALATGTAAAMGADVFSATESAYHARVRVSDHATAEVGLSSCAGHNSTYVDELSGEENNAVTVRLPEDEVIPDDDTGADRTIVTVQDVLQIRNQGPQTVRVWFSGEELGSGDRPSESVTFVGDSGTPITSESNAIELGIGTSQCVSLEFDSRPECNDCQLFETLDHFVVHAEPD